MQTFDGVAVLWMLSPGTTEYVNTVFYHIYLAVTSIGGVPPLSCRSPVPTHVDCHVSLVFHVNIVCYAYLVYCVYNYTEWPM